MKIQVPVIDLFAGPGGLGEGFARCETANFRCVVSIEKDESAHETLRLRAAHRALMRMQGPEGSSWALWDALVMKTPWHDLFRTLADSPDDAIRAACADAAAEAWCIELGPDSRETVADGIRERLRPWIRGRTLPRNAVLIGGPPCQAYSIVGRSRNRGTSGYRPEADHRHYLYREYLHIIHRLRPAVFIMENVKGMLTSNVLGYPIFESIRSDLTRPDLAVGEPCGLEYRLVALDTRGLFSTDPDPHDYVIRVERFGVPQARHRVVICGIRHDLLPKLRGLPSLGPEQRAPSVLETIGDLPRLWPTLSFRGKGMTLSGALQSALLTRAIRELRAGASATERDVADLMASVASLAASREPVDAGAPRILLRGRPRRPLTELQRWLHDRPTPVISNHESRAHMPDDLVRYLFVAAFGTIHGRSPKLRDFPRSLLPDHANIDPDNIEDTIFKDRFRVQVAGGCATTVTSHIGKDGHAFIHYDPEQFRSLTVREAARLQTFPDTYVFLGNRTSQYTQVGNAVPPMLAQRIADAVAAVLRDAGLA